MLFIDSNEGWIVGSQDTILHTTNGGTTWTALSPGTSGLTFVAVSFPVTVMPTGWVIGTDPSFTSPVVLKTVDGINWVNQTPAGFNDYPFDVDFADTGIGWIVKANAPAGSDHFWKTTNGGTSWSEVNSSTTVQFLYAIDAVDANNVWAAGSGGAIQYTSNGGTSWSPQTSGTLMDLYEIQFAGTSVGWAVGQGGTIVKTSNGGASWTLQTSGTPNDLSGIRVIDTNTVYVVGDLGTILKTTNGGLTWASVASGTTQALDSVSFVSPTLGWVVGGDDSDAQPGIALKTTTGGQ